jgi:hypothetical protein
MKNVISAGDSIPKAIPITRCSGRLNGALFNRVKPIVMNITTII